MILCHRQPTFSTGYNLCMPSREGLSAHGWARTFRSLAAGKSNGKRIVFMYHLCTIYVQFFVLSHITINELRHQICTIAYKRIFSESSQSQKTKQSHVFYHLVSYRDRTCLRILFFVGFSTYSPYRENTFSLQGENSIPARRKHYPCREKTLPLQGEQAIDVISIKNAL